MPAELAALDRGSTWQAPGRSRRTAARSARRSRAAWRLRGGSGGHQDPGRQRPRTLPDGSRAIVLSYTNAGQVTERGVEIGLGYQFTPEIRGDVSFTGFDFTVKSQARRPAGAQHAEQEGQRR